MASEYDWGDDPFDGDLNFDDDFDGSSKKKGFVRSFTTGFLSGITNKTIGDTDARLNTMRMVLPKTFGGAFSDVQRMNHERRQLIEDMKKESHGAVEDLQYLAKRAAAKLEGATPNKISSGLLKFSDKDFSDWKGSETSDPDSLPSMAESTDEELKEFLTNQEANAKLGRENNRKIGIETISAMTDIGGRTIGGITSLNSTVLKGNQILQQMLDHQRRVKAKQDTMLLNIQTRSFLANVKFYKFVEASNHRIISELKNISTASAMSDYQKTTHSQAMRRNLREGFFNTVRGQFGGIREFMMDRFGKDARSGAIGGVGEVLGSMRMAAEMSEGMPINMGSMLGDAAASMFINNLPRMIKSRKGREYVNKFKQRFPQQSKWAEEAYRKLEDVGNIASYSTGNMEGIANTLSRHYQGGYSFEEHASYEEYLYDVEPGQKPLSKAQWTLLNTARRVGNKGIAGVLDNTYGSSGTNYQLASRSLADSYEPSIWNKRSDRTLNEALPALLGAIHLSVEKLRTGDESLKAVSYDYTKGKIVSHNDRLNTVRKQVLGNSQFAGQARLANSTVDSLDTNKALTGKARQELAYRLARDGDSKMGFSPYNYMNLESEGVDPKIAEEIRKLMASEFGVTTDHYNRFRSGTDVDRLGMLTNLPTKEGRSRAVGLNESVKTLGNFTPDIAKQLDILKENGYYDALVESGIIKRNGSNSEVNMDVIWNNLRSRLANPDGKILDIFDKNTPGASRPLTINRGGDSNLSETLQQLGDLGGTIGSLNETLRTNMPGTGAVVDLLPLNKGIDLVNEHMTKLIGLADSRNDLLKMLVDRQPGNSNTTPQQQQEAAREKKGIIDRLKQFSFKDTFNTGMDKLLANEPLVLGGLLGGLAGLSLHDPKAAALLGGGAAIAMAYNRYRTASSGRGAEDSEDLYEEGSDIPILESFKLKRGDYYDATKGFVIDSWKKISGSVRDISNNTVIGARRLAGKLFTAENKEVFLSGLNKVRDFIVKTFKAIDPFGRAIAIKDKIANRFNQMDVYKEGQSTPTLLGKSFEGGAYWKRNSSGEMVQIKGWNEIDGPVFDREGNVLITQEEYDRGLKTIMGVSINKLGNNARRAGTMTGDLFGKLKDRFMPGARGAVDKVSGAFKSDQSAVVNSVDRIYYLLAKHWGIDVPGSQSAVSLMTGGGVKGTASALNPLNRLNSLADKERRIREEKDESVKDAIISMAGNFGFGKKEGEEEKKPSGLFGLLTSGLTGIRTALMSISGFMTGALWTGLKTLGSFASIGIRVLPVIAGGIVTMVKLLARSVGLGGRGSVAGDIADIGDGKKGGRGRTRGGRFMRGGLKLGAGLAAGFAADALINSGAIEEGGLVDNAVSIGGTALTVYGAAQMAGLTGGAAAAGGGVLAGLGSLGTAAIPLLFNPITLGALAVGALGYGIYRYVNRGSGKQLALRMAHYGIGDPDSDLASKVLKAEEVLSEYVVMGNGKASIAKTAPLGEVIRLFAKDQDSMDQAFTWFNGRFKPVFLTYMACLDAVKIGTLKEYDSAKSRNVYSVAKQAHQSISTMIPNPFSVVAVIDQETALLGERDTLIRASNLLKELEEYIDRKTDSADLKAIPTPKGTGDLLKERETLTKQLENPEQTWGRSLEGNKQQLLAKTRLSEVEKEIGNLNRAYQPGTIAEQAYIKDLLPDDRAMDLMTAIRVMCYGNNEDIPWRVEAVLKLERHCESLFTGSGEDIKFAGGIGELFSTFKAAFRVDDNDSNKWCLWFKDRFLPVLTNYMKLMMKYRRGRPGVVWKTLSATARFEIAKDLVETLVVINPTLTTSIWNVRAAPFKGQYSPGRSDKVSRMLNLLGEASNTAKLRDPEKEAANTNASSWAKTAEPHKVGGGYTRNQFNLDNPASSKTRGQLGLSGQYGTNSARTFNANNVYDINGNRGQFNPLGGSTDTSHLDMSGVETKGNDKGIKVPKQLAEQLLIREMLKQGFSDPREIAMVLALNNYESGGFSSTVENLNYSSPQRLVKMFREVKNLDQARALIKAGEVAIANTVYGGGKGKGLGNINPGDGWKYRGRGFTMLTGLANYKKTGEALGIDLVNNPTIASEDPNAMAAIAVNFYKTNPLLRSIAKGNSFSEAAKGLNGGLALPGMATRQSLYQEYLNRLTSGQLNANDKDQGTNFQGDMSMQKSSGMYGGSGGTSQTPPQQTTPMIGNGSAPPVGARPSGGSYGSGPSGQPMVKSYATQGGGLRLKSQEAVAGGAHHPGIERLCQIIQSRVPGFKEFTALNDAYHQNKGGNSKHTQGLALDFTLTNGKQGSANASNIVTEIVRQAGLTQSEFFVLDEYAKPSANATGGHVHFHFNSAGAADKFLKAAGGNANLQDTTAGGLFNRDQPVPPPQSKPTPVPQAQQGPTPAPAAYTPQPNNVTAPTAEQTTAKPQQPAPRETVTRETTGQPVDLSELTNELSKALASGNAESNKLLQGIFQQLVQLNKSNEKPLKSVDNL